MPKSQALVSARFAQLTFCRMVVVFRSIVLLVAQ